MQRTISCSSMRHSEKDRAGIVCMKTLVVHVKSGKPDVPLFPKKYTRLSPSLLTKHLLLHWHHSSWSGPKARVRRSRKTTTSNRYIMKAKDASREFSESRDLIRDSSPLGSRECDSWWQAIGFRNLLCKLRKKRTHYTHSFFSEMRELCSI